MYYTFHPKEHSITLLIDCAKCLHENLFAHQQNAARVPSGAHGQHNSQRVLKQNRGLWGKQNRGRKWKIRRWPLTWCCSAFAQFQQNNCLIVCETCICTQSPWNRPHLQELMWYWESLLPFALKWEVWAWSWNMLSTYNSPGFSRTSPNYSSWSTTLQQVLAKAGTCYSYVLVSS